MSNIRSYEERLKGFDWSLAKQELGYQDGSPLNIGAFCSDRICEMGLGQKTAMIWEGFDGEERRYTFDDLRMHSNAFATLLRQIGIGAGERVCLFMDRVPELYIGFLGILKIGAIAQPLFSAFGEESLLTRLEDAQTAAIITTKKHVRKVRRIREQLPSLRYIIVVDGERGKLKEGEVAFDWTKAAPGREASTGIPQTPRRPRCCTTPRARRASPRARSTSTTRSSRSTSRRSGCSTCTTDDIYWCNADPGWVTGTSYGIIGPWANGVTQVVLDAGFNDRALVRVHREVQGHGLVLGADRDPPADEGRRRAASASTTCPALRHLASVGEPLNAEAVIWSKEAFGHAVPRHLLADRDRLHRDHQLPRHADQAGLDGQAVPRHHRHRPRSARPTSRSTSRARSG